MTSYLATIGKTLLFVHVLASLGVCCARKKDRALQFQNKMRLPKTEKAGIIVGMRDELTGAKTSELESFQVGREKEDACPDMPVDEDRNNDAATTDGHDNDTRPMETISTRQPPFNPPPVPPPSRSELRQLTKDPKGRRRPQSMRFSMSKGKPRGMTVFPYKHQREEEKKPILPVDVSQFYPSSTPTTISCSDGLYPCDNEVEDDLIDIHVPASTMHRAPRKCGEKKDGIACSPVAIA